MTTFGVKFEFREKEEVTRTQFTYGRTDGRMAVTKLTVAFRNFANAPKKISASRSGRFALVEVPQYINPLTPEFPFKF